MTQKNWSIAGGDGQAVNVTNASQTVLLVDVEDVYLQTDVMVDNPGPNDVFILAGDSAVTATTLSMRVPANSVQPYYKGNAKHVALVCRDGQTQSVVVHVGGGQ